MNARVVYFTKFGHTQKVAEAIAEVLSGQGSVRTLSVDELSADVLSGADLVVMGSPTHRMNLPEALRPVFERTNHLMTSRLRPSGQYVFTTPEIPAQKTSLRAN